MKKFHFSFGLGKKSIFFKIAMSSLSLILLCTITISISIYNFAQKLLYEDIVQSNIALLVQIDANVSNLIQQLNTVINVSNSSLYFRNLLTEPCKNQIDKFQKQMELHRFLYNYYGIFTQYKACATIVGANGVSYTTYDGKNFVISIEDILSEPWIQPAVESPKIEKIVYTLSHSGISTVTQGKSVLLFARSLIDSYTMKQCGWIFLEIDPSGLEQLYSQSYQTGEFVFITDEAGNVISSNRNDVIGKKLYAVDKIPEYEFNRNIPVHSRVFDNTDCLAIKVKLTSIDGYLVKYIEKDIILDQLHDITTQIVFIAIAFCLSACITSLYLSRRITQPIVRLSKEMACTRYGTLPITDSTNQSDELYTLELTFSNLLNAVDSYTENIHKENVARREAELNALRMQINPHFLYNTLSSFRYLIENGYDRAEISESILHFIRLLRRTISNQQESITLKEELENLNSYVMLMNLRYENRIHIQTFISDELLNQKFVPKLLLQPILENAIFHGFPSSDSIIDISIFVCELNDVLRIEVSDSGCGIDEQTLERLNNGTYQAHQKMSGVGLSNIDQRLKLMYGQQYGLEICSTVGIGTIVTVKMPSHGELS